MIKAVRIQTLEEISEIIFDQAYDYFLIRLWEQVREKLFGRR